MILVCPVCYRIDHIFSEHCLIGGCYVAAAASVKILILGIHSEIISRNCFFKAAVACRIYMVINHIHNNANAPVVQCLNHLLKFVNSHLSHCRIGSVGALRHIEINRIVAPVILGCVHSLVYRAKIKYRIKVNIVDALLYQIFHTGRKVFCSVYSCATLCKCQIFASSL